jgi:hypothetical protein
MNTLHCTVCDRGAASLIPAEGQRLCPSCVEDYFAGKLQDMTASHYGEAYRFAKGNQLPVTPRVANRAQSSWESR